MLHDVCERSLDGDCDHVDGSRLSSFFLESHGDCVGACSDGSEEEVRVIKSIVFLGYDGVGIFKQVVVVVVSALIGTWCMCART